MITEMCFVEGEDPCPSVKWHLAMTEEEYTNAIEKLLSLCGSYGIEVQRTNESFCNFDPFNNVISLSTLFGLKKTYFKLLHEVGHALNDSHLGLLGDDDPCAYFIHYPGYVAKSGIPHKRHSISLSDYKRSFVSVLHEELDAWRKGIDVAHMIGLPLSLYEYWKHASECVESYIDEFCEVS